MAPATQLKIDENSPYYLHPSENPCLILVLPPLDTGNYHSWARGMKMALLSKNKLEFIDGSIQKPNQGDVLFNAWRRCNDMVLSWIIRSVSPCIASIAINLESAQLLWDVLKDRFSQSDAYRLADLQGEIFSISQGNRSVTEFFASLQNLWDEYNELNPIPKCACSGCSCNLGAAIRKSYDSTQVICFLRGLNKNFSNVKSQIMVMEPLPNLNRVFSLVLQFESQYLAENKIELGPNPEAIAYAQITGSGSHGNSGFVNKGFKKGFVNGIGKVKCFNCGGNHLVTSCFREFGYPPDPNLQPRYNKVNSVEEPEGRDQQFVQKEYMGTEDHSLQDFLAALANMSTDQLSLLAQLVHQLSTQQTPVPSQSFCASTTRAFHQPITTTRSLPSTSSAGSHIQEEHVNTASPGQYNQADD